MTIGGTATSQPAGSAGGDGFPWTAVIVAILAGAAAALVTTGVRRRRGRAALGGRA